MTSTETRALQAMLAHHDALADGVKSRVAELASAVDRGGNGHERAVADLVAYVAEEVLPHAVAEEQSIYRAAAEKGAAEIIAGMVDEHRKLVDHLEALATAGDATAAVSEAKAIEALFVAHVTKENELILPPLAADDAVDLDALLREMHRLTEAAQAADLPGHDASLAAGGAAAGGAAEAVPDADAALVRLLLEATAQMAAAGAGDRACRLAAEAWAAVRVPRPDLAVRLTAALHRLARSADAEPVVFSAGPPSRSPSTGGDGDAVLDVRALAPAQRHEKIFATYGALAAGTGFVLVNDHDPKPLRYQFEAEHADEFTWDVLEAGPEVWRVRIGRPGTSGDGAQPAAHGDGAQPAAHGGAGAAAPGGAEPELDVRRFPHGQRHDVIFATYGALAAGAGFVLVNDHDPKPLRYQFEAQHAGRYSWDYLEAGPEVWRVRIGRVAEAAG